MKSPEKTLAFYITPHGFGHAIRSLEVLRHMFKYCPVLNPIIVSDLPEFLVIQSLGRKVRTRRRCIDIGLVQKDSVLYDLGSTLKALKRLQETEAMIVEDELKFFRSEGISLVYSDVSFLAIKASAEAGIPSIGLSNFTWDWVYKALAGGDPSWDDIISWVRSCYGECSLFLQLPMHGDCSACPSILKVPLVARHAVTPRAEVRSTLGIETGQRAYLVSFTSLDMTGPALARVGLLENSIFFYKKPLEFPCRNSRSLDEIGLPYTDVVAAVDAVITKPGYGIVSDCIANGSRVLYTDRGSFPEYDILVAEMKRRIPSLHIPQADLYSGDWGTWLSKLQALPEMTSEFFRTDGADVCASKILKMLDQGRCS